VGTATQWLASLVGPKGDPGIGLTDDAVGQPCTVTLNNVAHNGVFAWVNVATQDHYVMSCDISLDPVLP
jgi:hypothetical protein